MNVALVCYRPTCRTVAEWRVVQAENPENHRLACDTHLPRLVHRFGRKVGPVVVEPLFAVADAAGLERLLTLVVMGASLYGLVSSTEAAATIAGLTDEARATLSQLVADPAPTPPGAGHVRTFYDPPGEDPADVIPFPDSAERYESPDDQA